MQKRRASEENATARAGTLNKQPSIDSVQLHSSQTACVSISFTTPLASGAVPRIISCAADSRRIGYAARKRKKRKKTSVVLRNLSLVSEGNRK